MCGRCPPVFDDEQLSIAFVWGVCCAIVLINTVRTHAKLVHPPRCGNCKYELAGLSDDALCPECGASPDARARTRTRDVLKIQWSLAPRLIPACVMFACALCLGKYPLALAQALWMTRTTAYSLSTSFILSFRSLDFVVPYGWAALPFLVAWSPFTAYIRSTCVRWLVCVLLFLVPCVLATLGEIDFPRRWGR